MRLFPGAFLAADLAGREVVPGWWIEGRWSDALLGGHPVQGLLKGVTALAAGGMQGGYSPGIRGLTARRQGGYRGSQRKENGAAAQKETASKMPSLFYHPLYSTYNSRTAPGSEGAA